jgi:hypothetical protein
LNERRRFGFHFFLFETFFFLLIFPPKAWVVSAIIALALAVFTFDPYIETHTVLDE